MRFSSIMLPCRAPPPPMAQLFVRMKESIAKVPTGIGIRDAIAKIKCPEINKAKTIPDWLPSGFLTEVMEFL